MGMLSASRYSVVDAVIKLNESVRTLRDEKQRLSKELSLYKLMPKSINGSAYAFAKELNYDDLRYCANHHIQNGAKTCAFFSGVDENYIYVISGETEKVKRVVSKINAAFNGKGGGKDGYAQGKISVSNVAEVEEMLNSLL